MGQPTPYERSYSFTDFSSGSPSSQPPGVQIDAELDAVGETLADVLTNLALIQRDDGVLRNGAVGVDQLNSTALALISGSAFNVAGPWASLTAYSPGDIVSDSGVVYLVMEAHVAGALATDVAAGRLVSVFDAAAVALETKLALATGLGLIGTSTGVDAQTALDAKASKAALLASTGLATIGEASGITAQAALDAKVATADLASPGGAALVATEAGGTVEDALGFVTPEQFGTTGTSDDHVAIQACVDYAAADNKIARIAKSYDIQYPIYVPPAVIIDGAGGTLRNTGNDANAQKNMCLIAGNYSAQYYIPKTIDGGAAASDSGANRPRIDFFTCSAAVAGDQKVTTVSAAHAGNFAAGDIVLVRSTTYNLSSDSTELPSTRCWNEVRSVNASTGVIELTYAIPDDIATPLIGKANVASPDVLDDRDLYVCVRATIRGGLSLESVNAHCMERGGALGCDFEFGTLKSKTGIFTNGIDYSKIKVHKIETDVGILDFAAGSCGSEIEVLKAVYRKTGRSGVVPLISLNENVVGNHYHFHDVDVQGFDTASQNLISVIAARRCELVIDNLNIPNAAGAACAFSNLTVGGVGTTQYTTNRNRVILKRVKHGSSLERLLMCTNTGGGIDLNYFEAHSEGTPTANNCYLLGTDWTIRGHYPAAKTIALNTSTGADIDVTGGSTLSGFTGTNVKRALLNGVSQFAAPQRMGAQPSASVSALGSGTPTCNPDASLGARKAYSFSGATALTINAPTNMADGETIYLSFLNSNGATDITPTYGSDLTGNAITFKAGGKTSLVSITRIGSIYLIGPVAIPT